MPFPPPPPPLPPQKTTYFHLRNASPYDFGLAMSNGYINHKYYDDDKHATTLILHNLCMSTALIDNYTISWKTSTGLDT